MPAEELEVWVVYDIEVDRIRNRVAEICKDYGLQRFQFSAFRGTLTRNMREELFLKVKKAMGDQPGRLAVVPICAKDLSGLREYIVEKTER